MKKLNLQSLLVAMFVLPFLFVVFAPAVYAGDDDSGFILRGNAGLALLTGDFFDDPDLNTLFEDDPGGVVEVSLLYGGKSGFVGGASLGIMNNTITVMDAADFADMRTVTILAIGQYRMPVGDRFVPYIMGGIGGNFNMFDESADVEAVCPTCDFEASTTFALRGGGGFDIYITDAVFLNFEGSWTMNRGDLTASIGGVTGGNALEFDASRFLVTGGIGVAL